MTVKTFFAKDLYIHFDWMQDDGADGYYTVVYAPKDFAPKDFAPQDCTEDQMGFTQRCQDYAEAYEYAMSFYRELKQKQKPHWSKERLDKFEANVRASHEQAGRAPQDDPLLTEARRRFRSSDRGESITAAQQRQQRLESHIDDIEAFGCHADDIVGLKCALSPDKQTCLWQVWITSFMDGPPQVRLYGEYPTRKKAAGVMGNWLKAIGEKTRKNQGKSKFELFVNKTEKNGIESGIFQE